jgi:DNA-damage-inducible protein J
MTTVVRARIDENVKAEASAVLAAMGLTMSDALRLLLVRVAAEKALPFEPWKPNEQTIAAMRAALAGDVTKSGNLNDLMADLNAE